MKLAEALRVLEQVAVGAIDRSSDQAKAEVVHVLDKAKARLLDPQFQWSTEANKGNEGVSAKSPHRTQSKLP